MSREDAYGAVQRNAMQAWSEGSDFAKLLKRDKAVMAHLKPADIDTLFDLAYHVKHVDTIFRRVFGSETKTAPAKPRRKR
jgi:adenylosuccinate lyase